MLKLILSYSNRDFRHLYPRRIESSRLKFSTMVCVRNCIGSAERERSRSLNPYIDAVCVYHWNRLGFFSQ
jgi:hypothetical protein